MKYIILIIVSLFSLSSLQAQKFQPLYTSSAEEIMHSARLLGNNKILAVHSANSFQFDENPFNSFFISHINTLISSEADLPTLYQSEVVIYDTDLNLEHSFDIPSSSDTLRVALHAVEDKNRFEIDILVGYVTAEIASYYILVCDLSLNLKYKIDVDPQIIEDNYLISYMDNISSQSADGKFLVSTIRGVFYINSLGEILKIRKEGMIFPKYSLPFDNGDILNINQNYVLMLSEDFNSIESADFDYNDPQPNSFALKAVKPPNKDYAYISGFGRIIPQDYPNTDMLWKVHEDFTFELIFADTLNTNTNSSFPSLFSLDTHNEENIYFCNHQNRCIYYSSEEDCTENLVFYNINGITGEINYSKILGGTAKYLALDIVALPDSGAIMFLARYKAGENLPNESDTYFIKFDKDGNFIELNPEDYTTNNIKPLNIPVFDVLVYPNPTTDFLNFKTHLNKNKIELNIYNINGQLVMTQAKITETIELTSLNKGVYLYELFQNGTKLQVGEFVKN